MSNEIKKVYSVGFYDDSSYADYFLTTAIFKNKIDAEKFIRKEQKHYTEPLQIKEDKLY